MLNYFKKVGFYTLILAIMQVSPLLAKSYSVPTGAAQIQLSFAPVVRQVSPAVVNIYASKQVTVRQSPFANDPIFERFFGRDSAFKHHFSPFSEQKRARVVNSLGSGVIIDPMGLIITNYHVVGQGNDVKIVLSDKREFAAQVVLVDQQTDLALLKIDADALPLPFLKFGESDALAVGDLVLALGNPFGIGQTVTSGIVSALARTTMGISDFEFFIQTDAAINPGNSGGALVNMAGELVGINTAIYSKNGANSGLGFATPAVMAKMLTRSYEQGATRVLRPWVGAVTKNVTAELAVSFGLSVPSGVIVSKIYPDSAAARAGLQADDVIVSVDGLPVADENALKFRIAAKSLGDVARLGVIRAGVGRQIVIRMEAPSETTPKNEALLGGSSPLSGAYVANLSPIIADDLGLTVYQGVVITGMEGRGQVTRFFRKGDIVETINGVAVADVREVQRLANSDRRDWKITAIRSGQRIVVNRVQ